MVGDNRCQGSLKPLPFNLIDHHINCFNCSRPSVVLTDNFGLARPATPAMAGIGTASPATVPPSDLCVEKPPQYIGPAPAVTAKAPATLPNSAAVTFRSLIILSSEAAAVLCPTLN